MHQHGRTDLRKDANKLQKDDENSEFISVKTINFASISKLDDREKLFDQLKDYRISTVLDRKLLLGVFNHLENIEFQSFKQRDLSDENDFSMSGSEGLEFAEDNYRSVDHMVAENNKSIEMEPMNITPSLIAASQSIEEIAGSTQSA